MQTGNVIDLQTFATKRKAKLYFADQCENRNYSNITESHTSISHSEEAGGIGYDFRIELSLIES
mgnify:CR=1 FL=1